MHQQFATAIHQKQLLVLDPVRVRAFHYGSTKFIGRFIVVCVDVVAD
jgi:hypothetical protein